MMSRKDKTIHNTGSGRRSEWGLVLDKKSGINGYLAIYGSNYMKIKEIMICYLDIKFCV